MPMPKSRMAGAGVDAAEAGEEAGDGAPDPGGSSAGAPAGAPAEETGAGDAIAAASGGTAWRGARAAQAVVKTRTKDRTASRMGLVWLILSP